MSGNSKGVELVVTGLLANTHDHEAGAPPAHVPFHLSYEEARPLEIQLGVGADDHRPWVFARSMLAGVIARPGDNHIVGDGDVKITRTSSGVTFGLLRGGESLVAVIDAAALTAFVKASEVMVPPGSEPTVDWDAALTGLGGATS